MLVSVVIPVYNNAATLPELCARLQAVLCQAAPAHEILFVNDRCPHGSLDVLRRLAAAPDVGVLALARNQGQHRAVLAGLAETRGQVAVVMDADLQDPPEALPDLLAHLTPHLGALFAGRRGLFQNRARMLSSRLFKTALHLATRGRIPRDAGLFMALNRPMIDALLAFDHPRPYIPALMARTGLPMRSFPIRRVAGTGPSNYTSAMRWRVALNGLRIALGPLPRRPHPRPHAEIRERLGLLAAPSSAPALTPLY